MDKNDIFIFISVDKNNLKSQIRIHLKGILCY